MRKKAIAIAIFCLSASILFGGANLQRTFTSRDMEYQLVDMLAREAGVVGLPGISPTSAGGLMIVLERIDRARLTPESQQDYDRLFAYLSGGNPEVVFEHTTMAVEVDGRLDFSASIADYSQFDWSNNGDVPLPDRKDETLIPFRYQDQFLSLLARVYFGSWFQLEGGFVVGNNNHHLYESSFGWLLTNYKGKMLNISMQNNFPATLQFDFPWRAGLSLGNDYFSFIFGRYPHSYGSGVTGNLIIGDNFTYQEMAQLEFMNNYFTYAISVTNFDQQISAKDEGWTGGNDGSMTAFSQRQFSGEQQYRIVHRFDVNLFDYVRFTMDLSTLYNTNNSFDLRFFYPFFFHHNLSNYTNDTSMSYYDEANNMIGFSLEAALQLGFSASFSFLIDQAQTYKETGNVPSAYGMQANIKQTTRTKAGRFNTYLEFVLTNPFLYLNGKKDANGEYNYNLDYIVGYYSMNLSEVGYSGYVSGPDSIVISLGTEFKADKNWSLGGSLTYRMRGEKGYRLCSAENPQGDHSYTYIDMSNAIFVGDETATVPSGPWEKVEHMIALRILGSYTFDVPNIEIYCGAAFHLYYNYNGNSNQDGIFKPQAMIGVKWTGIDNRWWKS